MPHSDDLLWGAVGDISRFAALLTMAELGLADHLAHGPLSSAELAERAGAHAPSLRRVLRELAGVGVVKVAGPDVYDLTEKGTALRSDVPDSVRSSIRMLGEESFWYAMGMLPATVRDGDSAFMKRYGPLYNHLARNPDVSRLFDDYMTARAIPFTEGLAKRYDFPATATMVDVAGGKGHILATVLHANPQMRGILFDLDHVSGHARQTLEAEGLTGRAEVVAGDMFAGVPAGGDIYLLASVLHNWDDDDAVKILRNVREAMNPDGRVLILEVVLPDSEEPHLGKDIDMRMLAIFNGGTERSREEYAAVLDQAGLALSDVVELGSGANLIEARRR
ncbi:O-methyltransferase, family 2 [[Actinomadura] parvosata subsp. kistnae]|uniref:Hydroxyneurosporene methyltransferase n=1 Tax=[Actinomadura] parvosata subsp. kistnae TaxID=1909395 RepID=A0A1V0A784_9ACTN|nr:methyltransferase [Nonomuraea sp. ATCC 55076]AQZ66075.1 hydroxyneurosporene methyltransferase [Nonomuraea sp. ATCC 55076]SPL97557.1 O-methyltransferase, family 2 [Actinomadura parvosata subsp. kistnae]